MATFRKRGSRWRAELYNRGERESRTFATKAEAVAWAHEREAELQHKAMPRKTLRQALSKYREEVSDTRAGGRWESIRLQKFEHDLTFVDKIMFQVTTADLAGWRDTRSRQVKPGSVRREMGLMNGVFERARREWKWIHVNPMRDVSKPKKPAPRRRRVSEDEIERMQFALGYTGGRPETKSQEVAVAFLLAIETAMRSSELLRLRRHDLHLDKRYLHVARSKNGDARDVPLTRRAVDLLKVLPDELFTVDDGSRDALFRAARQRAGIDNLTFHDARHEALTRLAQKVHVLDLARIAGHRDPRSLMVYYEATAEEIASQLD